MYIYIKNNFFVKKKIFKKTFQTEKWFCVSKTEMSPRIQEEQ